jgi:hypothetical protein
MTDTRKLEDKVPNSKMTTTDELKDAELDKVSGGGKTLAPKAKIPDGRFST